MIRNDFVARWEGRPDEAHEQAERLRDQLAATFRRGRPDELTPFAGQSAGLVRDVRPAGEIVRSIVAEARDALARAAG